MQLRHTLDFSEVLLRIKEANDAEISDILQAVIRRRKVLHPEWELLIFSLPHKDESERKQQLEELFNFLQKHS